MKVSYLFISTLFIITFILFISSCLFFISYIKMITVEIDIININYEWNEGNNNNNKQGIRNFTYERTYLLTNEARYRREHLQLTSKALCA